MTSEILRFSYGCLNIMALLSSKQTYEYHQQRCEGVAKQKHPPLGFCEEAKQSNVCQCLGPETVHALLLPLTLYCRVSEYSLLCA